MRFKLFDNLKMRGVVFALISVFSFSFMHAQTKKVTGVVTSNGEPLIGVSISVKSTGFGTITDFDGNYEIKAKKGDVILFDYLGFRKKEVKIADQTKLNIELIEDAQALDEVVVIGYGEIKKKEVIGAVGRVDSEVIEQTATSDIGSALQGQIAGVTVVASTGDPGAESNIQIRGLTSVDGSNSPLYVVDGVPFDGDPKLSMSEIESVDVLKDAASAAIYGTRGAAGVILITTKRAKEGVMKVSLNSYYGVQNITSSTPIMNTKDKFYTTHLQSAALNDLYYGNTWTVINNSPHQLTNNTNLFNLIENNQAPIQSHSLNVSGGKEGLSYNINANFFSQEGVLIKSKYDRFNVRANTQYNKGKWKIDTGMSFRIEDKASSPYGLIQDAIKYNPYQPELSLNTDEFTDAGEGTQATNLSYLGYKLLQTDTQENQYFDGRLNVKYQFNRDLSITARASASYNNGTRYIINPEFVAYDDQGDKIPSQQSRIRNVSSLDKKTTMETILNYKKRFNSHTFNFTAVYSAEKYTHSEFLADRYDVFNNDITVINGGTGDSYAESGRNRWTMDRETTLIGSLGRLQYNYKGKYLLSASVRRDGSSRFGKEHYGYFPSYSLGWNVSDESFWDPIKHVMPSFKLRASRGTTGNQGIADYSYASVIDLQQDYVFGNDDAQNLVVGAIQTAYANPEVKWETSVSTNAGLDVSFLKNKLTASVDYYVTNKKDMLFPVVIPPSTGAGLDGQVTLNAGDMENKGLEFAMNYRHSGKFSWNAGLTYTQNNNKITKMSGTNKIIYFDDSTISGHDNDQDLTTVIAEGYEAGAFFLMKTDGTIKTEEELAEYKKLESEKETAELGDLRYVDSNGDGTIDINDRVYVGSGTPDFEMGLNLGANYKRFDFSMQLYGSFGAEILNGNKALAYKSSSHQDLVYQWTPANNTSNIPVNRNATHNNYRGHTDYWMEDGTFVRLRNVSLGYTFNKNKIEQFGLKRLRLYVAAQNPLTLTKYTGYDPEVGGNGLSTRGIDKGRYPISRQVRAGVQIDF